jgi:hypothetical protein
MILVKYAEFVQISGRDVEGKLRVRKGILIDFVVIYRQSSYSIHIESYFLP